MDQNQTLGRGEIHFSRFKAGTKTPEGFRYLGNTPEFNLSVNSEMLAHYSMDHGTKVKDKSVNLQTDFASTFTCDNIDLENVALFFLGAKSIVSQGVVASVDETLTEVILGRSYQIGESDSQPVGVRKITMTTIKVGAVALVAGTDYTLDADRGLITFLEDSEVVTDGDDVVMDYALAATSYARVVSGNAQIEGAIRFDAYNAEGQQIDYRMAYVRISPNGDLPLKGDDWMATPFNVEIVKLPDREAIYANGQPYTP